MCQTIVLSQRGPVLITQCTECKTLIVWCHNLLLNFTPEQFKMFREFTSIVDVDDCLVPFPDGEEKLVLHTPHSDICFIFTLDEWEDFNAAMDEADYMQQVYNLIHH